MYSLKQVNPSNWDNGLTSMLWNVVRYVIIEQIMIGDMTQSVLM